jgi:hypothetical protein
LACQQGDPNGPDGDFDPDIVNKKYSQRCAVLEQGKDHGNRDETVVVDAIAK